MFPIQNLPLELVLKILSQGNLQTLMRLSLVSHDWNPIANDSVLWKRLIYRPESQDINVSHLKGSELFWKVPQFSILQEQYQALHPLYPYIVSIAQEIENVPWIENEMHSKIAQAFSLVEFLEKQQPEDQIQYTKALLISDSLPVFSEHHSNLFSFLAKLVAKQPEWIVDIFYILSFQHMISRRHYSDDYITLLNSESAIIKFSTDPLLKAARATLFQNSLFWLGYCERLETIGPENIDKVLKEPDFQSGILHYKFGVAQLCCLIQKSQRGPVLLLDQECHDIKELLFQSEQNKRIYLKKLIHQHPNGKQLILKAPQLSLTRSTLKLFKLAYRADDDLILMIDEDIFLKQWADLKEKYLNKELTPDWLQKILEMEPLEFVTRLFHEQYKQWAESHQSMQMSFPRSIPIWEDCVKNITVYVIDGSKFRLGYLDNPDYRELVTTGQLSLHELLRAEPDELIQHLPHQSSYRPM